MTGYRLRVTPGYAVRWMRRNWWRLLYAVVWAGIGIAIRESVAATRPEHWYVGSEMIPAAVCWILAVRVAAGEKRVGK